MDWLARLDAPTTARAVLTAMITPAVLISACGSLILSTSTRLAAVRRLRTAVVAAGWAPVYWPPVVLGMLGGFLLLWASVLLILEARHAHAMVHAEMDFLWRLGQHHAGDDLVARQRTRKTFRRQ